VTVEIEEANAGMVVGGGVVVGGIVVAVVAGAVVASPGMVGVPFDVCVEAHAASNRLTAPKYTIRERGTATPRFCPEMAGVGVAGPAVAPGGVRVDWRR